MLRQGVPLQAERPAEAGVSKILLIKDNETPIKVFPPPPPPPPTRGRGSVPAAWSARGAGGRSARPSRGCGGGTQVASSGTSLGRGRGSAWGGVTRVPPPQPHTHCTARRWARAGRHLPRTPSISSSTVQPDGGTRPKKRGGAGEKPPQTWPRPSSRACCGSSRVPLGTFWGNFGGSPRTKTSRTLRGSSCSVSTWTQRWTWPCRRRVRVSGPAGSSPSAAEGWVPRDPKPQHNSPRPPSPAPRSPAAGPAGDGRGVTAGTAAMPARAQSSARSCSRRPLHWYSSGGWGARCQGGSR